MDGKGPLKTYGDDGQGLPVAGTAEPSVKHTSPVILAACAGGICRTPSDTLRIEPRSKMGINSRD